MTKYIITTIVFIILATLWLQHTNKVSEARQNYWDKQQELCQAVGWYSESGERQDCQPVDYLRNKGI
jgi:hypothetical protein